MPVRGRCGRVRAEGSGSVHESDAWARTRDGRTGRSRTALGYGENHSDARGKLLAGSGAKTWRLIGADRDDATCPFPGDAAEFGRIRCSAANSPRIEVEDRWDMAGGE